MPSLISILNQHKHSKSDYEALAETIFNELAKQDDAEETDLKVHVDACARRFKILTIFDLHCLGELRKVKKWIIGSVILAVFGKQILGVAVGLLKGLTFMDALQLFLSL
jgi:hypothetical protein